MTRATGTTAASAVDTDRQLCRAKKGASRTRSSTVILVSQARMTEIGDDEQPAEHAGAARRATRSSNTMSGQCHRYSE